MCVSKRRFYIHAVVPSRFSHTLLNAHKHIPLFHLSLFPSLSLPLSLSLLSLYLSLYLSIFVYLSLSLSLRFWKSLKQISLLLSVFVFVFVTLRLSLSFTHSFSFSHICLFTTLSLPLSHFFYPKILLSFPLAPAPCGIDTLQRI